MLSRTSIVPLRTAEEALLRRVHALNQTQAIELSEIEFCRFKLLIEAAFCAVAFAHGEGFLLAFDQDADYESPNFQWFKARFARFVYIDRIAIDAEFRGKGFARELYHHLDTEVIALPHDLITCEVNETPPNPASDAFHAKLGFVELGLGHPSSGKIVRYLGKRLAGS